ncbi:Xylose isomerase domain-containing protein TIM barrel [Solidesulfovibrio carbinoliphilus subsp. oakridgensis]|uniref:Xylose isomerase domain-containing protein TIM barrel n=1 Tax=Solidesulfovibrio carbinoliphilus subsp. oakridgensis TaxID=694327 RepID=G7Q598_9BACT|nr:TIM barrel protein [Solidesulfovibrio carbinoliphilus]EHJ48421.1 Xylose isomerase domain-containing protein TIM barrel [Solidesulfovibrio carbinoliphilus subsp. oakridgensis]
MPRFYVNLNLRVADRDPALVSRHLDGGVAPELGLDPVLMDAKTPAWHADLARRLDEAGLARTLHLPFFDLQPGSADARIREASRDRLKAAMDTAQAYRPDRLVGHAAYNRFLYIRSFPDWAARAADTWAAVLSVWPGHPPLCLENTFETDPATVSGAVAALRERLPAGQAASVGACLDIGHWYSFAEGKSRDNLAAWIDALAPFLLHLHLHDNDGSFDQHLGPGQGEIPFEALFALLAARNLHPTVTFEPHSPAAFAAALAFTKRHQDYFGEE